MAPLIRADVNAANWAEALHNVTAAAAIARVCWGPSREGGWKDPFPAARGGGWCLCYLCVLGEAAWSLRQGPRVEGHC